MASVTLIAMTRSARHTLRAIHLRPETKRPSRLREAVKCSTGSIAKGSCTLCSTFRYSLTWLGLGLGLGLGFGFGLGLGLGWAPRVTRSCCSARAS